MKKISLFLFSFLFIALVGCYKDKGNYDYIDIDINEVKIRQPTGVSVSAQLGEPIVFTPTLIYVNEEQRDTNIYKWEYYFDPFGLVCTERNMSIVFDDVEIGETYNGLIIVTDTTTGAQYSSNVSFTYVNPYETGWLLLANDANKSKLHLLQKVNEEWTKAEDIYKLVHNKELGSSPKSIICQRVNPVIGYARVEIRVFQDSPGGLVLDATTYMPIETFGEEFVTGALPEGFKPKDAYSKGYIGLIVGENGELYTKGISSAVAYPHERFVSVPTTYGTEKLNVQHLMKDPLRSNSAYFYDLTTHSFYLIYGGSAQRAGELFLIIPPDGWESEGAPAPNALEDYEVIECQVKNAATNDQDIISLLQHNETGKMYIYTFSCNIANARLGVSNIGFQEFSATDKINNTDLLHFLRKRPYLFWADGSKLYWYDLRTKNYQMMKDYGSNISAIESCYLTNNVICVALENGEIYLQDIQEETFISGEDNVIYNTTVSGRVVDIYYKEF